MADSNYRKTFLEIKENETVWIDARVAQATTQLTKDQKKYQTLLLVDQEKHEQTVMYFALPDAEFVELKKGQVLAFFLQAGSYQGKKNFKVKGLGTNIQCDEKLFSDTGNLKSPKDSWSYLEGVAKKLRPTLSAITSEALKRHGKTFRRALPGETFNRAYGCLEATEKLVKMLQGKTFAYKSLESVDTDLILAAALLYFIPESRYVDDEGKIREEYFTHGREVMVSVTHEEAVNACLKRFKKHSEEFKEDGKRLLELWLTYPKEKKASTLNSYLLRSEATLLFQEEEYIRLYESMAEQGVSTKDGYPVHKMTRFLSDHPLTIEEVNKTMDGQL